MNIKGKVFQQSGIADFQLVWGMFLFLQNMITWAWNFAIKTSLTLSDEMVHTTFDNCKETSDNVVSFSLSSGRLWTGSQSCSHRSSRCGHFPRAVGPWPDCPVRGKNRSNGTPFSALNRDWRTGHVGRVNLTLFRSVHSIPIPARVSLLLHTHMRNLHHVSHSASVLVWQRVQTPRSEWLLDSSPRQALRVYLRYRQRQEPVATMINLCS